MLLCLLIRAGRVHRAAHTVTHLWMSEDPLTKEFCTTTPMEWLLLTQYWQQNHPTSKTRGGRPGQRGGMCPHRSATAATSNIYLSFFLARTNRGRERGREGAIVAAAATNNINSIEFWNCGFGGWNNEASSPSPLSSVPPFVPFFALCGDDAGAACSEHTFSIDLHGSSKRRHHMCVIWMWKYETINE